MPPTPTRVLVFNATEDAHAADAIMADWSRRKVDRQFASVTVASTVEETGLSPIEDDHDEFCYDLSLLRHSYDVLVVLATSDAEGDPTDAFGSLYFALVKAAASGDLPLS